MAYSKPILEPESQDYGACHFDLEHRPTQFRIAKVTPKKVGQFVTLWKRGQSGVTEPFDQGDPTEIFVIAVLAGPNFGCFIFPKSELIQRGIVSARGIGGKRGFRVYPPWDRPDNATAKKSQYWQSKWFLCVEVDKRQVPAEPRQMLDKSAQ